MHVHSTVIFSIPYYLLVYIRDVFLLVFLMEYLYDRVKRPLAVQTAWKEKFSRTLISLVIISLFRTTLSRYEPITHDYTISKAMTRKVEKIDL